MPAAAAAESIPFVKARRAGGAVEATYRRAAITLAPAPTPASARQAISDGALTATAMSTFAAA
ncbi:MAG: hypothetical protein QN178_07195 [Armatimonadota bacterium]|nr:hypothetical protein [Armatimonadota bacterium]